MITDTHILTLLLLYYELFMYYLEAPLDENVTFVWLKTLPQEVEHNKQVAPMNASQPIPNKCVYISLINLMQHTHTKNVMQESRKKSTEYENLFVLNLFKGCANIVI